MAKRFVQKLPLLNLNGGRPPLLTDDFAKGYDVGSEWNYGALKYICTDATNNAAVWQLISGGSSGDRNIDGGAPDSVYLPIQNVDGGTP